MKRFIRIIVLIIAACILLSSFSVTAAACSTVSGVFGDNLTWKLNTHSGKLTISGHGDMPDCSVWEGDIGFRDYESSTPWQYMHLGDQIRSVIVKRGVTSIGNDAFAHCKSLTKVSLPDGLYRIGETAFEESGLKTLRIPASVSEIGALAFAHCNDLEEVHIENNHGFYIFVDAFDDTAYYNDPANWEDNLLYIGNHLIRGLKEIKGVCTIRQGTVSIAANAFANYSNDDSDFHDQVTEIHLPDSIEYIGDWAFYNCEKLSKVRLPETGVYFGNEVFYGTALAKDSTNWENGYMYIDNYIVDSEEYRLVPDAKIRERAIGVENYSYVTEIPSDIEDVYCSSYYVGSGIHLSESVTQVTIPGNAKRVSDISNYVDDDHYVLSDNYDVITDIFVDEKNPYFKSIDGVLYSKDGKTLIRYPGGRKERSFTVPDGVQAIGRHAFSYTYSDGNHPGRLRDVRVYRV